jgi:hypothetical protein
MVTLQYPLPELRAAAYAGMTDVERAAFATVRQQRIVRLFAFHRPRYRKASWCMSTEDAQAVWLHDRPPAVLQRRNVAGEDVLSLSEDGGILTVNLIPLPGIMIPNSEPVTPENFRRPSP